MRLSLILILLIFTAPLIAAPMFNFDYATFRVSDVDLLQIYTMIHRKSIEFKPRAGGFIAEYSILVEIMRGDSVLASSGYDRTDKVDSMEDVSPSHKIPEETSFHIREGDYSVVVTVADKTSGESTIKRKEVTIEAYSWDNLSVSDIEFASDIKRTNKKGLFTKNQLQIIPHADRVFGGEAKTAYYYSEIYNLCTAEPGAQYTIKRTIYDQNDQPVKELPDKVRDQNAASVVEADYFSIATLPTGTFFLKIKVTDGITGAVAEREKSFWIFKPGEEVEEQKFTAISELKKTFDEMSQKELEQEIDYIRYLTSRDEDRIVKRLKPEAYDAFLLDFWTRKDASGYMRQRYLMRIEITEQRYGTKIQEGWKTDRGRVLILYGEPDYNERRLFDLSAPDTEIWYYDQIEGGVVFLFTDIKGTGDLRQVFSSMRGEFVDAGWVQQMEVRNPQFLNEIRQR